jgi:spermidine synthase
MPPLDAIPMEAVILDPAARNGMPSMHLGWALAAMLVTMLMRNRGLIVSYALIAVFTFLATLGLGEHYLIDLVVALPFNLAVVAMCIANGAMDSRLRRKIIAFGLGTWLLWIVLLRFAFPLFILFPPLAWVLVLLTVIASVWFSMRLVKAVASAETMSSPALDAVPTSADAGQPLLLVLCMFFLSGFAALMYEVVFSKQLALTFGSTSTAAYTVLSVYMGGMALGGWIGGRLAERAGSALRMYAGIEFIIGSYCAITPFIFVFCRWLYVTLAIDLPPDAGYLTVLRLVLGATALLIPTMLMGMTLPVLASAINKGRQGWGRAIGLLYGANTLGAALGALLAGYAILSTIGLTKTILTAAILNVIVAAIALRMHSRNALGEPSAAAASHVEPEADHEQPGPRLALLQLMLIGFVTLALEVVYFHLLAVVAGNSAYAFALMLFSFLIGLGGGAELGRRLLAALKMPALIVYIQIALGLVIALGLLGWEAIPGYFADFESYPLTRSFGARELVRGLVCFAVMVPPALLIGMLYPMLMHYVGSARQSGGVRAVGRATALNTLGNISGVLVAAFVLLPMVGSFRSVLLLAGLAIVAAATVAFSMKRARVAVAGAAMAGAVFVAVMPGQFDLDELASGANVYFARMDFGKTIDASESPDGGLTSVVQRPGKDGLKTLLTNGKFQGTDSFAGEMVAQIGIAVAPLLHTDKRDNALVIGYGTGATTRALHDAGFKSLDVAELSGDVVKLANRHFERVNSRVTEQKGVRTFVTDGRNFLMLTSAKYDVISIELSSIWFAGAAALYNSDFYTIARAKLKDDGVLQQWVQLHHLSPIDIVYIIGSARTQFKYVTLYAIGGQGVLVLTNDATRIATAANAQLLEQTPGMRELVNAFGGHIRNMNEQLILSPEATDRLLTASGQPMSYWQSTDDNSLLEYSTPRGNAAANAQSMEANIAFLRANSGAR